jgi:hypothetical protein
VIVLQAPVLHPACAAPRTQDLLTWLPRHFCRRRRASRAGELFLETGGGGAGVVEDGVGWWFSRTGFGWTLNMVSLSACALGWPYHHRAAEEQQQAARLQSGGDSERIGVLARERHEDKKTGSRSQGAERANRR